MPARAAVQHLLETDAELAALGVEEVYGSNAADSAPENLFLVCHWEAGTAAFGDRGTDSLLVWAHSKDRDYGPLDAVLRRVRELLAEATHLLGEDGRTLTTARWNGWGDDAYDDGYNTITKNADFTIVSR